METAIPKLPNSMAKKQFFILKNAVNMRIIILEVELITLGSSFQTTKVYPSLMYFKMLAFPSHRSTISLVLSAKFVNNLCS